MNNLVGVSQGGYLNRTRNFDAMSRLISVTNPESGTTSYSYRTSGNAFCAGDLSLPCTRTDARGITTTYSYETLNRLSSKTYSDTTPAAYFYYDATSWWGHSVSNAVGKLVAQGTYISSTGVWPTAENFTYDAMGRTLQEYSCLPIMCWSGSGAGKAIQSYGYDYVGDLVSTTNGEGVTLNYSYNQAQRLTGVTSSLNDSNHPSPLFSGAHYNAAGSLLSASLDNGLINESRCYDGRLRLENISDTALSNTLYSLTVPSSGYCGYSGIWGYAPDNNIVGAWDSVNGNWSYAYDPFNRLSSASTTGQSYTYAYDRFGNRWQQNGTHSMIESFSGNNNRMDNYTYDAAGNLLADGTAWYTYDAENRVVSANSGTSTYVYNVNGWRVRKTVASLTTDYLYDLSGNQVAAVNGSGTWIRGEVYAAGRHLATYTGGTSGSTYFNFADHLGTERARVTVAGSLCETITSLPFGDWQTISGSCGDPSPMHFTGKERDSESGNDNFGARYYSSSLGRFMHVDPGRPLWTDPQTLNRYNYVRNNPLKLVDPSGKYPVINLADNHYAQFASLVAEMLLTPGGRAAMRQIVNDPRPSYFTSAISLPSTPPTSFTNGQTWVLEDHAKTNSGALIGINAGTNTAVDFGNIDAAHEAGLLKDPTGLQTLAHEISHVTADLGAGDSYAAAQAAGFQGDLPTSMTGSAEAFGQGILSELGNMAGSWGVFGPDSEQSMNIQSAIDQANSILQQGWDTWNTGHTNPEEELQQEGR